jgi:dTDP-4-amino-4,6-dideoxygalactose transaminase
MLQTQKPSLGIEELEAVKKVFETRWLGLGSAVFEFENVIKEYLGNKNVIAVNTGTSALHLALDAFGIGKDDEVIVPSLTFCATIQAIAILGAIPVFCEIDPKTLNIDIEDAKKRITKKTKAIMPVHYCGNACDMDALLALGRDKGIVIIEDAAHAFGSTYKGTRIGSFGDATCFSFDPIKNITCGEGGAVVLENDTIAEVIRRKRILGIDKDTWHRYQNRRSWFYEVTTQGYRYHMSNINAAIGLAQFKKLDKFSKKKRRIVSIYNEQLSHLEGLELIHWNLEETAPFMYIIRVLNGKRNEMMDFLKEKGVETGIHYIPNHIQPQFSQYAGPLPITEKVWTEILTLPLFYEMTDEDVDLVIGSVTSFFDR